MQAFWERDAVTLLVKLYKLYPILYDDKHEKYFNKLAKKEALCEIVLQLQTVRPDTTIEEVKQKLRHLRKQFLIELKRIRKLPLNRRDNKIKFGYFNELEFLEPHINPRKNSTNIKIISVKSLKTSSKPEDMNFESHFIPAHNTESDQTSTSNVEYATDLSTGIKREPQNAPNSKIDQFSPAIGNLVTQTLANIQDEHRRSQFIKDILSCISKVFD